MNFHKLGEHTKVKLPILTKKMKKAFSDTEIDRFFLACENADDLLLFHFFLASGERRCEVENEWWSDLDIDAGTVQVTEHPGFTPKDHEERIIPLPDSLLDALRRHRERNPEALYIFGEGQEKMGKPDARLKEIAFRAGINCGHCVNTAGQSCRDFAVCEKAHPHRFRRTYATRQHRRGVPTRTLQVLLGHADMKTTEGYLEAEDAQDISLREKVNAAFGALAVVGGAA